jgi:hypothetical protein
MRRADAHHSALGFRFKPFGNSLGEIIVNPDAETGLAENGQTIPSITIRVRQHKIAQQGDQIVQ